ncbi:hypothetical protein H1R20_g15338, partial [Candolleomyces eurysporus]
MSTQPERALNAKNKGNTLFKAGKLDEAAKCYKEAVALDPKSLVYPSNLSAALYELGQYSSCVETVLVAWKLIESPINDLSGIAKKLSSRLAKALVLGLQDGTIPSSLVRENCAEIESIRAISPDDPSWAVYAGLEEKIISGQYEIAQKDAKKHFSKLPLFHATPPSRLAARHAFASLIGLHHITSSHRTPKAEQSVSLGLLHDFSLTSQQKSALKAHMTLLDVHPATIARDIIFFMFFDQLIKLDTQIADAERRKQRGKDKSGTQNDTLEGLRMEKLEILSTVFYLYSGYMVPPYCYDRWVSAVRELHAILSNPHASSAEGPWLPPYIHLAPSSYPSLLHYLNHWLKPPVPTVKFTRLMKHVGGFERTKQLQEMHASGALGPKYSSMPDPLTRQKMEAEEKVDALLSGHNYPSRRGNGATKRSGAAKEKERDEKAKNERDLRTVLTKLLGYSQDEVNKMPLTKLRQKVKDARDDIVELLICMKVEKSVMYGVNGSMLREGEWVGAGATVNKAGMEVPGIMGSVAGGAHGGGGVSAHAPPKELREKYHKGQFDVWVERVEKDERDMANSPSTGGGGSSSSPSTPTKSKGKKHSKASSSSSSSAPSPFSFSSFTPAGGSSGGSSKWYHPKNDWDKTRLSQSARLIRQSWKANMSLDDGKHGMLDQELDLDLFKNIHSFAEWDEIYGLGGPGTGISFSSSVNDSEKGRGGEGLLEGDEGYQRKKDSPAWTYAAAFFMGVVHAIKELTGGDGEEGTGTDRLRIEFVADGLHEYLAKIKAGADEARPESFPTKWTRIWLGSVPDYTHGTLNTMTYVVPALQEDNPSSSVASNCLFNSPVWADDDEFCYNYTMLLPHELKRYLGIHTLNPNAVQDILNINSQQPLPRPLYALATKQELFPWLTRLFLSHLHPGFTEPRPRLIKTPNGLPAFFGLLVRLREVGYPSHWLSEWVQSVLDNELVADHLVYAKTLPRPVGERTSGKVTEHKVRLDPWFLEIEKILATGKDALPFVVRLPQNVFWEKGKEAQSARDIGTFEATGLEPTIEYGMFYNHDAVAALLFYKSPTRDVWGAKDFKSLLLKIGKVVDNVEAPPSPVPKGAFFILTAPEFVDLKAVPPGMKRAVGGGLQGMMATLMRGAMGTQEEEEDGPGRGEVKWRMGKASAKKMIREKWNMVVFRMDLWMPLTHPCPASRWIFHND